MYLLTNFHNGEVNPSWKNTSISNAKKSYSDSRKEIGGRKRKHSNVSKNTPQATYFVKESKNEGMLNTPS